MIYKFTNRAKKVIEIANDISIEFKKSERKIRIE